MARRAAAHHGDLRAALVDAALALVAEKGVSGLSVAEAARRAGVSAAAPYRHFANRTALLSAAATAAGRQRSEQMQAATEDVRVHDIHHGDQFLRAIDTLGAIAGVYVRYALTQGAAFELILSDELQDSSPSRPPVRHCDCWTGPACPAPSSASPS